MDVILLLLYIITAVIIVMLTIISFILIGIASDIKEVLSMLEYRL